MNKESTQGAPCEVETLRYDSTEAVRVLEYVLKEAKAGKVAGLGICQINSDRSTQNFWCIEQRTHRKTLIGELAALQYRILREDE